MILSTILQPPRAASEREIAAVRPRRDTRRERARRNRRRLSAGLIASVALHALAVLLSPLVVRYITPTEIYRPPVPATLPRSQGTQIVELLVTETPQPQPTPEREPEPEPELEIPPALGGESSLSAAERLRPRVGDWRLWVRTPEPEREPTPAEREEQLNATLRSRIVALNDSIAAEEARRAAQNDWTVGEEGNKWGISPGRLHLGPVTLPFPFSFGPTREQADRMGEWAEIQRQAGQAEADEAIDDRIKAIRERRERERAKTKPASDSTSTR